VTQPEPGETVDQQPEPVETVDQQPEPVEAVDQEYDEFGFLERYAAHEGIEWHGRPAVRRESASVRAGRLSGLVWGTDPPELAFLHGAGQNAHTWDSVAMALDRPAIAIDLPGHGHSDWRADQDYRPPANAASIGEWLDRLGGAPRAAVGMSLGGLTAICLAAASDTALTCVVVIDVTPGSMTRGPQRVQQREGAVGLIGGQRTFATFDEMLAATAARAPGRPVESLRPGILHNARRLDDGRWAWRYDQEGFGQPGSADARESLAGRLWDDLSRISVPVMLVRGGRSGVVADEDRSEFLRRQPGARVEVVDGAGHAVQSDRAVRLAELISDFTDSAR
jgi:pimeloyl-ACP methyl ester carboxylesterase